MSGLTERFNFVIVVTLKSTVCLKNLACILVHSGLRTLCVMYNVPPKNGITKGSYVKLRRDGRAAEGASLEN